jgi:tetratricopeptide (TPR) repeat protein
LALARFLGRRCRTEDALALCQQAWKRAPAEAVIAAGVAVLEAGKKVTDKQRQQIEEWIAEGLRKQPSSTSIRLSLASLRGQQGRYDQAESIFREVLTSEPENLAGLNNLAWLLSFQTGREEEALDLVERAIEIAGMDATLLDTRAVILLKTGKTNLALRDLRAAIAMSPQKPVLYFHLARANQAAKQDAEARKAFRHAEQLGLKPEAADPRERELLTSLSRDLAVP